MNFCFLYGIVIKTIRKFNKKKQQQVLQIQSIIQKKNKIS